MNTGKLAIQSLGTAHKRKMKYSTDDYDELNSTVGTQDNSHGQCKKVLQHLFFSTDFPCLAHQSMTSLISPTGGAKVHPIETVGTVSERAGMRRNSTAGKSSTKSGKDGNAAIELMDSIMNNYAASAKQLPSIKDTGGDGMESKKSTKSKKVSTAEDDAVREFDTKTPKGRPTLLPTFEEEDSTRPLPKTKDGNEVGKSLKLSKAGQSVVAANRVGKRRSSI